MTDRRHGRSWHWMTAVLWLQVFMIIGVLVVALFLYKDCGQKKGILVQALFTFACVEQGRH